MIELFEQYDGLLKQDHCINACDNYIAILKEKDSYEYQVLRKGEKQSCYSINCEKELFYFKTSYFVGINWIVENKLPIYIQPKLNNESMQIDYMRMLLDAIEEPENLKHLDDLLYIYFDKPHIPITQKQDLLSPFLIALFLKVMKQIVKKGLKKSYYSKIENLNARVKGKILVSKNIKQNLVSGKKINTICQYQEFGVNCDENKILKKAYRFSQRVIQKFENGFDKTPLLQWINYIHPAFEQVSDDIDITKIKTFRSNPLYKEYDQAIKLALLILKRYAYNINNTEQQRIMTPPFWIDMSKLFELYVYKKLRNIFTSKEVKYHYKAKYQELDFILKFTNQADFKFVIDTKYKPKYHNQSVIIDDIRQISGYARIEKVYKELKVTDYRQNIDCLIIYSHQKSDEDFTINHFILDDQNEIPKSNIQKLKKESGYVNIYKLGIKLPEIL